MENSRAAMESPWLHALWGKAELQMSYFPREASRSLHLRHCAELAAARWICAVQGLSGEV